MLEEDLYLTPTPTELELGLDEFFNELRDFRPRRRIGRPEGRAALRGSPTRVSLATERWDPSGKFFIYIFSNTFPVDFLVRLFQMGVFCVCR
jgi:hypothetical protein